MKLCFIAPASIIHTVKWVNSMYERGHEVHLLTMHNPKLHKINKGVKIHKLPIPAPWGYYLNIYFAKNLINKINPDLINTHYASGYGTLSRLINYSPTLLSVWGSDVFDFPYENILKKKILKKNLSAATKIASTSWVMKEQTKKFVEPDLPIEVTPFGIDLNKFKSIDDFKSDDNTINIGIVKKLERKYGIKYLIKATRELIDKLVSNDYKDLAQKIKLTIVGKGTQFQNLKQLATKLQLADITNFVGAVPHDQVPKYLNQLDIYCAPSVLESESFGVAIIEASACEVPVIVSNVGGLPEVVEDKKTGYVVEPKNHVELADKLYELVLDKKERNLLGENGRKRVEELYDWDKNVEFMEEIYKGLI